MVDLLTIAGGRGSGECLQNLTFLKVKFSQLPAHPYIQLPAVFQLPSCFKIWHGPKFDMGWPAPKIWHVVNVCVGCKEIYFTEQIGTEQMFDLKFVIMHKNYVKSFTKKSWHLDKIVLKLYCGRVSNFGPGKRTIPGNVKGLTLQLVLK